MKILSHPHEVQLKIRIDTRDCAAYIHYQYGNFERWRSTPHTTSEYVRDASGTMERVYDFFDRQWRGC